MNTITLNGTASTTLAGLLIQSLPPITRPKMRIQQTTVDGSRITFDVYGGKIVCSATAKQAGTAAPVIAAGSDSTFVTILSGDNSESRPDSDYATVSAEVTKYLTADVAAGTT